MHGLSFSLGSTVLLYMTMLRYNCCIHGINKFKKIHLRISLRPGLRPTLFSLQIELGNPSTTSILILCFDRLLANCDFHRSKVAMLTKHFLQFFALFGMNHIWSKKEMPEVGNTHIDHILVLSIAEIRPFVVPHICKASGVHFSSPSAFGVKYRLNLSNTGKKAYWSIYIYFIDIYI